MNNKKLIVLKISGASLKGSNNEIIDIDFLNEIARQIKVLSCDYKMAIVLGGGNIWRGNIAKNIKMERYKADQMGMLATVMNSLALQSALSNVDVKAKIFSTIEMEKIADSYIIRNLKSSLENGEIAILSCGTGRPYFTTDTGIAVSAAELGASYILMGKNNVDGVYDSDPNINPNAVFYEKLNYTKAIEDGLGVMDVTAATICRQCNIKTIVFRINKENGIIDALNKKSKFTLISEDSEIETNNSNEMKIEAKIENDLVIFDLSKEKNIESTDECNCKCDCENLNDVAQVNLDENKNKEYKINIVNKLINSFDNGEDKVLESYISELSNLNANLIDRSQKKLEEIVNLEKIKRGNKF